MWVLIGVAVLVALVIFMLSVPLDASLRFDTAGRPRFSIRLAWLFGLVDKDLSRKKKRPEAEKPERKWRVGRAGDMVYVLRTRGLVRQVVRLLRDVFRLPRFRDFLAELRVGLGDPADTGLLFALVGPASALLNYRYPRSVRLQPVFGDEAVLEGKLYGKVRLRPIQLVPPLLRFGCSSAAMRAAGRLVARKWRRKR